MPRAQAARPTVTIPTVEHKQCSKCHMTKGAAEFFRREQSHDGLQSWCRACKNAARQGNVSTHQALQHQSYTGMSDSMGGPGAASGHICGLRFSRLSFEIDYGRRDRFSLSGAVMHLQVITCTMHTMEPCRRRI